MMIMDVILIVAVLAAVAAVESRDLRQAVGALGLVGGCLAAVFLVFQSYFFAFFQLAVVAGVVYLFLRTMTNKKVEKEKERLSSPVSYVVMALFVAAALYLFLPALRALPDPLEISTKYAETFRVYDAFGMLVVVAVAGVTVMALLRSRERGEEID